MTNLIQFDATTGEFINDMVPKGAVMFVQTKWPDGDREVYQFTGIRTAAEALGAFEGTEHAYDAWYHETLENGDIDHSERQMPLMVDLSSAWCARHSMPLSADDFPEWVLRIEGRAWCESVADEMATQADDLAAHNRSFGGAA